MRQAFETAPRNGEVVILEDDASGTYDVARWSVEAGEWVGEDGEPTKITPTHWYPYRFFPFSSSQAPPQRPATSDVIAPRSVAATAPVTVEAFEAQTAPVEANDIGGDLGAEIAKAHASGIQEAKDRFNALR
jgi:hypothetical protein